MNIRNIFLVVASLYLCGCTTLPSALSSNQSDSRIVTTLDFTDGSQLRRVVPLTHASYEQFYGLEDSNAYSAVVSPSGSITIKEAIYEENSEYFEQAKESLLEDWPVDYMSNKTAVLSVDFLQFADTETALLVSEARLMAQEEDYTQALIMLDQVAAQDTDSVAVFAAKAEIYSGLGELSNAVGFFNQAIIRAPNNERLFYSRAYRHYLLKNYASAIDDLIKAIDIAPERWEPYNLLSQTYNRMGEPNAALKYSFKGAKVRTDGFFEDKIGWLYLSVDKYQMAKTAFNKAIEMNNQNGSSLSGLARVLYQDEEYVMALETVEKAIEVDGENTYDLNLKGLILDSLNRYQPAIASYKKVIEYFQPDDMTYNNLGWIYLKNKSYAQAIATFNEQVAQDLGNLRQQYNLATAYFFNGDYQKSLNEFMTALEKDSTENAFAHAWIAHNLIRLKKPLQALHHLKIVARTNVNYPDSLYIEQKKELNGFKEIVSELVFLLEQENQTQQQREAEALLNLRQIQL